MNGIWMYTRRAMLTVALGLAAYGTAAANNLPGTAVRRDPQARVFDRFIASAGPHGGAHVVPVGRAATPRPLFWTPPRVTGHEVRLRPDWWIPTDHRIRAPFDGPLHRFVRGRHIGSQPPATPPDPSGLEAIDGYAGGSVNGSAGAPTTTVTPEPFTLLLLGSGLLGIGGVGAARRRGRETT